MADSALYYCSSRAERLLAATAHLLVLALAVLLHGQGGHDQRISAHHQLLPAGLGLRSHPARALAAAGPGRPLRGEIKG